MQVGEHEHSQFGRRKGSFGDVNIFFQYISFALHSTEEFDCLSMEMFSDGTKAQIEMIAGMLEDKLEAAARDR